MCVLQGVTTLARSYLYPLDLAQIADLAAFLRAQMSLFFGHIVSRTTGDLSKGKCRFVEFLNLNIYERCCGSMPLSSFTFFKYALF